MSYSAWISLIDNFAISPSKSFVDRQTDRQIQFVFILPCLYTHRWYECSFIAFSVISWEIKFVAPPVFTNIVRLKRRVALGNVASETKQNTAKGIREIRHLIPGYSDLDSTNVVVPCKYTLVYITISVIFLILQASLVLRGK